MFTIANSINIPRSSKLQGQQGEIKEEEYELLDKQKGTQNRQDDDIFIIISIINHSFLCAMIINNANDFLETLWKNSESQQISSSFPNSSSNATAIVYKIIKKDMVIRTPHFALYRGLEKTKQLGRPDNPTVTFKEVTIKKYQTISRFESYGIYNSKGLKQPAQYSFLKRISKQWLLKNSIRLLEWKDQFYLLMSNMEHTLYDKIKFGVREFREMKQLKDSKSIKGQFLNELAKKILQVLCSCHQHKPSFFLGGLRPCFIGVLDRFQSEHKKSYVYGVIDYGLANTQPGKLGKPGNYLHKYDMAYLAPQFHSADLNEKSDVWSLGCILYELISCGQKLIKQSNFHVLSPNDQTALIDDKLNQLVYRLECWNNSKYKLSLGAIDVLKSCLQVNPQLRISSSKLLQMLNQQKPFLQHPSIAAKLIPELSLFYESRIIYDISIQIFRLNCIQDSIMSVFEEMYFNKSKSVSKYHLYPLLKLASCYYLEAFSKLKDKSRTFAKNEKWDKYSQVKRIQEEKKLTDIRDKAAAKMFQELQQEKKQDVKKEVLRQFPEIRDDKVLNPKQVFEAYLKYVKDAFYHQENANFYKFMLFIQFYMNQPSQMQRYLQIHTGSAVNLKLTKEELKQKKDPEIVYIYCLNKVTTIIEKKVADILALDDKAEKERKMKEYMDSVLDN